MNMANENSTVNQIVSLLPSRLQLRFESLGTYVRSVIEEERQILGMRERISQEDIQRIQLAVFIYSLNSFFRIGTSAAKSASSTFEELGFTSFKIGSSYFSQNNETTMRGETLALKLEKMLAKSTLGKHIRSSYSMRDLISRLLQELKNES
jgi:hypothetical protein